MRAIIPLFCAYLNLFCPCPSSSTTTSPQSTQLDHAAATPASSSSTLLNLETPVANPNSDEIALAFGAKESLLTPDQSYLDKRSVGPFSSKPVCKDSAPGHKRGLFDRVSNSLKRPSPQTKCVPRQLFMLQAARNAELNRRAEFDRLLGDEPVQAPIKMAAVTETAGAGGGEDEVGRRRRWDRWFVAKREELLEAFGRAWAEYLM